MDSNIKKSLIIVLTIILISTIWVIAFNIEQKGNNSKTSDSAYYDWKKKYVVSVNSNMDRVINPQNNNVTVSEGMGYGMLFSASIGDKKQFEKLWEYTKSYLDENGLMNWKISSSGNVVGWGSATDADQDIAYSLLLASKKWNSEIYQHEAIKIINAIKNKEVSSDYVILPGDNWMANPPINLSYISPLYYPEFGLVNDKIYWNKVLAVNLKILQNNVNAKTGLFPDWINTNNSIQFKDDEFGYDAIRIPIRLIQYYKNCGDNIAKSLLQKEYDFFSIKGHNELVAGYSVDGNPLVKYINTEYLASFSAISLINSNSQFNITVISQLKNANDSSYYGCSLKTWILFILDGKLQ